MTDDEIGMVLRDRLSEAIQRYRDAVVKYAGSGSDSDASELERNRRHVVEVRAAVSFLALVRLSPDGPMLLDWGGGGGGFSGGGASGGW